MTNLPVEIPEVKSNMRVDETNPQIIEFRKQCKSIDWHCEFSDDRRVYRSAINHMENVIRSAKKAGLHADVIEFILEGEAPKHTNIIPSNSKIRML